MSFVNRYPDNIERDLVRIYNDYVDSLVNNRLDKIIREFDKEVDDINDQLHKLEEAERDKKENNIESKVKKITGLLIASAYASYVIEKRNVPKNVNSKTADINDPEIERLKSEWILLNAGLIRSVGKDVTNEIVNTTREGLISKTALSSDIVKKNYREKLKSVINRIKSKSSYWAEDQTTKFYNSVKISLIRLSGAPGYIWSTQLDNRVRPTHMRMHGTYFTWSEVSDIGALPGEEDRCRCNAIESWGYGNPKAATERAYGRAIYNKRVTSERISSRAGAIERNRKFKTVPAEEKKKRIKTLKKQNRRDSAKLRKLESKISEIENRLNK